MPQYTPPPPTLDHLNPIQRYMQKGQLERRDWIGLLALVVGYFFVRPYIQKAAKWWFSDEKMIAGEKAQKEHMERRAKIHANAIRSGKKQNDTLIEQLDDTSTGVAVSGSKVDDGNLVVNRKSKTQPNGAKPMEDQLLDWDDEPARVDAGSEKADVMQWLDKWDQ